MARRHRSIKCEFRVTELESIVASHQTFVAWHVDCRQISRKLMASKCDFPLLLIFFPFLQLFSLPISFGYFLVSGRRSSMISELLHTACEIIEEKQRNSLGLLRRRSLALAL